MFDKIKKQKQQKLNRNSLHQFPQLLEPPSSIMLKCYPNIDRLNLLKILTTIHMNYILCTYLQCLEKANLINQQLGQLQNIVKLEQVKIAIIGGGVMGRFFLNSILVMSKMGINMTNVTLSTRQQEDFQFYRQNFGVNVVFDNEGAVEKANIIIVTVPATLDNWIIADIKQVLNKLVVQKSTINKQTITDRKLLNPLVFITTSNMTKNKLQKLFNFPVLIPFVRGHQQQYLDIVLKSCKFDPKIAEKDNYIQELQRFTKQRVSAISKQLKDTLYFVFERYFYNADKQRKFSSVGSSQKNSKSGKTLNMNETKLQESSNQSGKASQSVSLKKGNEQKIQSNQSSLNLSSYSSNYAANLSSYNAEVVKNMVEQAMTAKGNLEDTFLVRGRKWRMAYSNFIA